MADQKIDGALFKSMVIEGALAIAENKERANELNVFPVPDGDTGTNMSMTMASAMTELDKLEEQLLEQAEPQRFENQLHRCRRTLLKLSAYYAQLDELGDTLAANRNGLFSKKLCRGFELFSHRAGRLHSQTASLREYSLQLHQIYQSKIDLKQNRVMQFLTVVTTVFMPLTLITGWYGMNFHSMPELNAPWAYPAVILVSLAILLAEVLFFRRKKW